MGEKEVEGGTGGVLYIEAQKEASANRSIEKFFQAVGFIFSIGGFFLRNTLSDKKRISIPSGRVRFISFFLNFENKLPLRYDKLNWCLHAF